MKTVFFVRRFYYFSFGVLGNFNSVLTTIVMRKDTTITKEDMEYAIGLKLILEKYLYSVYDKLIKLRIKTRRRLTER